MKLHISFLLSAIVVLTSAAAIRKRDPNANSQCNEYCNSPKYINKFPHHPSIPGSYIVTLKKSSDIDSHLNSISKIIGKPRGEIVHGDDPYGEHFGDVSASSDTCEQKVQAQFKHGEKFAYVASFNKDTLAKVLDSDDVDYAEPNYIVTAQATAVQYGAPWGLSRLSNQNRLSIDDRSVFQYLDYPTDNVAVYVVDSGINIDHEEFGGRAVNAANLVSGEGYEDDFGHGTHVAGTIGGVNFGVAKKVKLYNVKVLSSDGTGSNAAIIAGINYVVSQKKKNPSGRFVLNLSIGGPESLAEETALRAAVNAGVHIVGAAGNSNIDACTTSPGSSSKDGIIVVGATSSMDTFALFSNWGTCVDVLAPGVDIVSAWNKGPQSIHCLQGTSMSSPHVAGLVAYWYAQDGSLTPTKMKAKVIQYAQTGKISGLSNGTPNRMVWNGVGGY